MTKLKRLITKLFRKAVHQAEVNEAAKEILKQNFEEAYNCGVYLKKASVDEWIPLDNNKDYQFIGIITEIQP